MTRYVTAHKGVALGPSALDSARGPRTDGRTIYIAGSSKDLARADAAIAMARGEGWEVTFDWPENIRAHGGVANEALDLEYAEDVAHQCRVAAVTASVMWLLLDPSLRSPGAHVELGYRLALCRNSHLFLTGPRPQSSIHYAGATWLGVDDAAMRRVLAGRGWGR